MTKVLQNKSKKYKELSHFNHNSQEGTKIFDKTLVNCGIVNSAGHGL